MNFSAKKVLSLLLPMVSLLLFQFALAQAAEQPRIYLAADSENSGAQETTVAVIVENAPLIYGADIRLIFDPAMLEVIRLEAGTFIDPEQSFVLQEEFDNQGGSIDYALTLRNPAPPVTGSGMLARVIFRAKAANQTTVRLEQGQFGTQEGVVIEPSLAEEMTFNVLFDEGAETLTIEAPEPPPDSTNLISPTKDEQRETNSTLLYLLVALGGGALVIGGQVLLSSLWKRVRG